MPNRRWDTDERFTGVHDGGTLAEPVQRLLEMLSTAGWVAEEPEAHLLPHIETTIAELGLTLVRWEDLDGVLEVVVDVAGRPRGAQRIAAFALIASIAEATTHVRVSESGVFEVITGMLPGDGSFATHGHLLRIRTQGGADRAG